MKELRKELRSNKKQYKKAKAEERQPLEELRIILKEKLKTVRRAEWHKRRQKERARKQANFLSHPFGFARTLLGDKRNSKLEASEEEINTYLRSTMSDLLKDQDLERNDRLIPQKPSEFPFNMSMPTWKEIKEVVQAARSASAPGLSGVPYTVYKRYTGILQRLWKIIRVIWRRGRIVDLWRFAESIWIPKEEASKTWINLGLYPY